MKTIVNEKAPEHKESMMDYLAREGARKMLVEALEEEVTMYLERRRYERSKSLEKGYRNGTRERKLQVLGAGLKLSVPQVDGGEFESSILRPYQRRTEGVEELFRRLYLEGLSSRDFEPALRALIGDGATLSAHDPASVCKVSIGPGHRPGRSDALYSMSGDGVPGPGWRRRTRHYWCLWESTRKARKS
jgi:transposase-like protein